MEVISIVKGNIKMKKYVITAAVVLLLPVIYVIVIHTLLTKTAAEEPPEGIEHIIVLGAKINGEDLSLSLYYRVREALDYLKANENTKVIVAGGQGEGEWITEAEAMARYFIENGIEEERILKEERSTTTYENIKFSREIVGDEVSELVVVTSDYHLYRALIIAKRQGFDAYPLAAETPWVVRGQLWVREYAAVLKTLIFDW